ncbi:uncharacterized protein [Typha angustifolia]|uniref:uncharacterized protein n=1 Tax=Typha angustifolia TaxID=59011 RepID=UPI003C2F4F1B
MELSFSLLLLMLLFSNLLLHTSTALSMQSKEELKQFKEENDLYRTSQRNEIFHPLTGLCVLRKALTDPLKLGPCARSDAWSYTPQNYLVVKGTYYCVQSIGVGQPVKLSIICTPSDSQWFMKTYSEKTHLSTVLPDGTKVCLDIDGDGMVVSNPCNGFGSSGASDADSQWFELVTEYKRTPLGME